MTEPIRILLVDDSPHFLAAAADYLHFQGVFQVVGVSAGGEDAFAQSGKLLPDVILLDLNLAGGESGLNLIPRFKKELPKTKIIVLTIMEDSTFRAAALQAGAHDFVSKKTMTDTLVPTIRKQVNVDSIAEGSTLLAPSLGVRIGNLQSQIRNRKSKTAKL